MIVKNLPSEKPREEKVEQEYITVVTGGPKKYFNRKTIRNPRYVRPKKQPKNVVALHPELIEAFRLARKNKYLTQQDLAHLLRTNQSAISKFENGHGNPTLEFLDRLAKLYNKQLKITLK